MLRRFRTILTPSRADTTIGCGVEAPYLEITKDIVTDLMKETVKEKHNHWKERCLAESDEHHYEKQTTVWCRTMKRP